MYIVNDVTSMYTEVYIWYSSYHRHGNHVPYTVYAVERKILIIVLPIYIS